MNNVNLIGRLTDAPKVNYTKEQKAVGRFSLAVNTGYGENKRVDYINIIAWEKTAENCERYLTKGSKIAVSGRIQTGNYTNKEGKKVYTTDVVANNIEFLVTKQKENNEDNDFQELAEDVPF